MKKRLLFYLITLISTSLFANLQLFDPAIIREQIESKTYDLRLHLRNLLRHQPPSKDIIIVSVDEKSIQEIGRWPWKRDVVAGLIKNISRDRPRVIGVDIILSEREGRESDERLEMAIKEAGNVVLAMAFIVPEGNRKTPTIKDVPDFLWDSAFMEVRSVKGIKWRQWAIKPSSVIPPVAEFSKASSLGHVYTHPDMDGVTRWEIMYLNYGDDCYPSFPLQVARIALRMEMKDIVLYGGSGIKLGSRFISTDLSGRVLINYRGKEHSFDYISASDVIKGKISAGTFRDRIVLIGTSALGTYDQKVTPFSANMPGVEKNANAVENIILNNFIRKSHGVIELAVILFTGILLGIIIPRLKAIAGAAFAIGFIALYILIGCYLLVYEDMWINLVYPVSNMFVIFVSQTVAKFFLEEKRSREIRRMFSSYVSPKIVEELVSHPEKARLGGERKTVTVLFSDLIGFTSLSERLSPEEVVSMLNEYLREMVDIIFRWDGTLDKFVGDEIVAFWGAPVDQEDHAELAVRCAINMSDRLDKMQEAWRNEGRAVLDCGIGINTGEVMIGNIGVQGKKMDYTVIGDHVNLAARVEKLTRQYGSRILITENTLKAIEPAIKKGSVGHLELKEIACVQVKGREEEIRLFGLRGLKHNIT
ncbi:MAG: adenylate/guanylate cyclase domain-containing protein [Thermodesulfovibrionales bacterium]